MHHFIENSSFYNYNVYKIFGIAVITEMQFVSLILLTRVFKYFFDIQFNMYIILILITIFIRISARIIDYSDEALISSSDSKLKNRQLEKKYKLIYYLLRVSWNPLTNIVFVPHNKIYILAYQFIISHINKCSDVSCPCQKIRNGSVEYDAFIGKHVVYTKEDFYRESKFLHNMSFIRELFCNLILKISNESKSVDNDWKIFYASFLLHEKRLIAKSCFYTIGMLKENIGFRQWNVCNRLLDAIYQHLCILNENSEKNEALSALDLVKVLKIDKNYSLLELKILEFLDSYSQFFIAIVD